MARFNRNIPILLYDKYTDNFIVFTQLKIVDANEIALSGVRVLICHSLLNTGKLLSGQ